jgi:hypothetical protein
MEIEEERYGLKVFRGDFDPRPGDGGEPRMAAVINAVRKIGVRQASEGLFKVPSF